MIPLAFPHSIAAEYLWRTREINDIPLLAEITDKRLEEKPLPTDLVIHLRIEHFFVDYRTPHYFRTGLTMMYVPNGGGGHVKQPWTSDSVFEVHVRPLLSILWA